MAVTLYLIRHGLTQETWRAAISGKGKIPAERPGPAGTDRTEGNPSVPPRRGAVHQPSPPLPADGANPVSHAGAGPLPSLSEQDFGLFEGKHTSSSKTIPLTAIGWIRPACCRHLEAKAARH